VYVPVGVVAPFVVTESDDVTSAPVDVNEPLPNRAVAPAGRPVSPLGVLVLRVTAHGGVLFPLKLVITDPKVAVPPSWMLTEEGATVTDMTFESVNAEVAVPDVAPVAVTL
jgi:hypothetical protein